jgi:cellulose biosynthesis protein BcsQ
MKTLTFFNNKGGVGKTSLVYHLSWMFAELGKSVVAVDLDPQSNLTSAFLEEEDVEDLWTDEGQPHTIVGAIRPLTERLGDLNPPFVKSINQRIGLVPGDLDLSLFEDRLAESWRACLDDNRANREDAFRVTTAFYRIMRRAASQRGAEIVFVDVGPNLGALNRAALVASDLVVVPLAADLFSLHGLRNLGPTLRQWREGWSTRKQRAQDSSLLSELPAGSMTPVGYVVIQPSVRERYPVKAFRRWTTRIPSDYHSRILGEPEGQEIGDPDPSCLATLKNYRSLAPLAHDARKPMFLLNSSDGALGGHMKAVNGCFDDFQKLAYRIAKACKIRVEDPLPPRASQAL